MKKIVTLFVSITLLFGLLIPVFAYVPGQFLPEENEHAMFPSDYVSVSGSMNSHAANYDYAIDIIGKRSGIIDNFYAPFTGKVVAMDNPGTYSNMVILESLNEVEYANGTIAFMTCKFNHDNNISDMYIGKVIGRGTTFYQEGGFGSGSPTTFATHVHMQCAQGKFAGYNTTDYPSGNRVLKNEINPLSALFTSTNTIVNRSNTAGSYNWTEIENHISYAYVVFNYKIVNTSSLNIRATASTSGTIIGSVPQNTLVEVTSFNAAGNWGYLKYNGITGWICLDVYAEQRGMFILDERTLN